MATVNFSVPVDVKNAFNKAFEGENKSAILAVLMRQAVEERKRPFAFSVLFAVAIDALLRLRRRIRPATAAATGRARRKGRP